jgi:hypothetical protein
VISFFFSLNHLIFIHGSGGTDSQVTLWRVASRSSAPWIGNDEFENEDELLERENDPPDVKVILS